jgi:hypothetical protein
MACAFDDLLAKHANTLRPSARQHRRIEATLRQIFAWLRRAPFAPGTSVYTQGSVRLGTSIRPQPGGEFDADIVWQLPLTLFTSSAAEMFEQAGEHLAQIPDFAGILKRRRRCWTLVYDRQYHVDVTPAVIDLNRGTSAILVFDQPSQDWRSSDPVGFAAWFGRRTRPLRKTCTTHVNLAYPMRAAGIQTDTSQPFVRRTPPLVGAIRLLKRRRDLWFSGPDAPNSMVITTLASTFYSGECTVAAALENGLAKIARAVQGCSKCTFVVNPTNPSEVFSENWIGNSSAKRSFIAFIADFRAQLNLAARTRKQHQMASRLDRIFGCMG